MNVDLRLQSFECDVQSDGKVVRAGKNIAARIKGELHDDKKAGFFAAHNATMIEMVEMTGGNDQWWK